MKADEPTGSDANSSRGDKHVEPETTAMEPGTLDHDALDVDAMAPGKRVFKLLQGYVWHPSEQDVDLGDHLPERIGEDVRVLWDPLPRAPFTFFDDGTLAETQTVYQFTVLAFLDSEDEPGRMVPWLAETLQSQLETTPPDVGWQIMEDLREMAR